MRMTPHLSLIYPTWKRVCLRLKGGQMLAATGVLFTQLTARNRYLIHPINLVTVLLLTNSMNLKKIYNLCLCWTMYLSRKYSVHLGHVQSSVGIKQIRGQHLLAMDSFIFYTKGVGLKIVLPEPHPLQHLHGRLQPLSETMDSTLFPMQMAPSWFSPSPPTSQPPRATSTTGWRQSPPVWRTAALRFT